MNRTALFCIYADDYELNNSVKYLLEELHNVADKMVVIVNGKCSDMQWLNENAEIVLIRDNIGFDAGAYKYALRTREVKSLIEDSDELIICNDTFWGPFVSFENIFAFMEADKCDYWGLNYSDTGVWEFLQSYFLVFRKKVINASVLYDFFDRNVDEHNSSIEQVLLYFERGLSRYLDKCGFKRGYYCLQQYHILKCYEGSVINDQLPILKKKALSEKYFDINKASLTISWINNNTDYPIEYILSEIRQEYAKVIEIDKNINFRPLDLPSIEASAKRIGDVMSFISNHKNIYIWGTGGYASNILNELMVVYGEKIPRAHILGFISSDKQNSYFRGKPVFSPDEVNLDMCSICFFMNRKNTEDVLSEHNFVGDVLNLWRIDV